MTLEIKNRHPLKDKKIEELREKINNEFNQDLLTQKNNVEIGQFLDKEVILIDGVPCFFKKDKRFIFSLHGVNKLKPPKKHVTVDMGAVEYIANGADVMSPGIIDADKGIEEDDQVWVRDERHNKPLAIGIAKIDGEQMIQQKQGKAIKILHFVGDKYWNFLAKSL